MPDRLGLPEGANALLTARARAAAKRDRVALDAIGAELRRLGVAVRDERRQQYYRIVDAAPGGSQRSA